MTKSMSTESLDKGISIIKEDVMEDTTRVVINS